ncbi:unnamed protein product [Pocillopora meandrina]|uniref:Uncharacterized protein n=1 Tax=Pocillopora meandrina TaxID=46732 RepID=A0AAU9VV84_9CNID|nr:unnamed protein product [Pocillopora meandrina]
MIMSGSIRRVENGPVRYAHIFTKKMANSTLNVTRCNNLWKTRMGLRTARKYKILDSEKILLQRSKAKDRVEKCKEGQARYTPVKMIVEIEGEGSMRDLIKFICENELKNFV